MFGMKLPMCRCAYCQRQNRAAVSGLKNLILSIRWLIRPPKLGFVPIKRKRE